MSWCKTEIPALEWRYAGAATKNLGAIADACVLIVNN
jgi:hypothetical protein